MAMQAAGALRWLLAGALSMGGIYLALPRARLIR